MRCVIAWSLAAVCLLAVMGCGGDLTQADMRKHAIRRSSGDAQDKEKSTAATTKRAKENALDEAMAGTSPRKRPLGAANLAGAGAPASPQGREAAPSANNAAPQTPAGKPDVRVTAATETRVTQQAGPDTLQNSAKPLSPIERRQRSIDNLTRIGDAIRRHSQEKGQVFSPARYDAVGRPLLSWRVELLPYLGYQQLYEDFLRDQPWDSPHNQALLGRIPEVYQSPERFDEKTNYLVPEASYTPFNLRPPGVSFASVEDGPANTVAVVEVDDAAAVPWTQPADLELKLNEFRKRAGNLREDGIFVVWLDGSVGRILRNCSDGDLKAIFSYDAGDIFAAYGVRAEATATPAAAELKTPPDGDAAAATSPAKMGTVPAVPAQQQAGALRPPHTGPAPPARLPIPDPLSIEQARALVRELYQKEYETQKEISQQRALAQRMLKQADQMSSDPAGRYVLLDIALKMSTRIGDTSTAMSALDDLVATFAVDELEMTHEALVTLARTDRSRTGVSRLLTKARGLIDQAISQEQFETAESLCQIATGAARQLGDRDAANQVQQQAQLVAESQKALRDVQRILATLTDKDDPEANLRVGRYYCFIQGEWEKGLPLLAHGSDAHLRQLAEEELRNPTVPGDQLKLADGWWELGSQDSPRQKPLQQRAVYWYQRALPELPSGLWRAKADMRLKEFRRLHGPADVASFGEQPASRPSAASD